MIEHSRSASFACMRPWVWVSTQKLIDRDGRIMQPYCCPSSEPNRAGRLSGPTWAEHTLQRMQSPRKTHLDTLHAAPDFTNERLLGIQLFKEYSTFWILRQHFFFLVYLGKDEYPWMNNSHKISVSPEANPWHTHWPLRASACQDLCSLIADGSRRIQNQSRAGF